MSHAHHKVLIIDDDMGPRESLRILLKPQYDVACADCVTKGMTLLRDRNPDVVVMDIRMPGMSGIDGLREIRKLDQHVAVIMLTGFGALETAQDAIRLGANDYLKKPFDTAEMLSAIERNIQRAEINRRRAATERDLQDLNKRLVTELASKDRMASLGQASAELVHDLRNPLTVILGYVQVLAGELERAKQTTQGAPQESADYLEIIENSVRRCRELIDTWLSIARNGTRSFIQVELNDVVSESVDELKSLAQEKGAELIPAIDQGDHRILGDGVQLRRVFYNLIGNAIDALGTQGRVEVSLVRQNESVIVEVRDNGVGIDPETLKRVFEPYYTTKPAGKGSGLGLFITRRIVEDHDGRVTMESKVGQGTTARVEFPASA